MCNVCEMPSPKRNMFLLSAMPNEHWVVARISAVAEPNALRQRRERIVQAVVSEILSSQSKWATREEAVKRMWQAGFYTHTAQDIDVVV